MLAPYPLELAPQAGRHANCGTLLLIRIVALNAYNPETKRVWIFQASPLQLAIWQLGFTERRHPDVGEQL
jgi:hypothetical protein